MVRTADTIVKKLASHGFHAYYAGGYVRDMLLGIPSDDIDIVTDATPDEIEKIFSKTVPVGKQFGVVLVIVGGKSYEVATFRSEGEYLDKRRPSKVEFVDAETDARRRDFTINGMFYDPLQDKIIDYVGGKADLRAGIVRFIGEAGDRIEEDNLRLLRAVRFKISLNFRYAPGTLAAIKRKAGLIKNVSGERIKYELNRTLASGQRYLALPELHNCELLKYVLPEVEHLRGVPQPEIFHREGDVFDHVCLAIKSLAKNVGTHLVWAVMLHDIAKPKTMILTDRIRYPNHAEESALMATQILRRLKFPNYEVGVISWLIENHMKIAVINQMRPAKRLAFLTDPKFPDLIRLAKADAMGTQPVNIEFVKELEKQALEAKKWKQSKEHLKDTRLINGYDLIRIGLTPGINFKTILEEVEDSHIEGKLRTKREAEEYIKSHFLNK